MGLEDELELVNFPIDLGPDYGYFKVIQLYTGSKPVMVLGNLHAQHFEILRDFLDSRGMPFTPIFPNLGDRIPSSGGDGQPYKVAGAGLISIDAPRKEFKLPEGASSIYKSANPEHSAIFERRMIKDGWTKKS